MVLGINMNLVTGRLTFSTLLLMLFKAVRPLTSPLPIAAFCFCTAAPEKLKKKNL
jgi:hypothetical protein